jgi:hypothetical protein
MSKTGQNPAVWQALAVIGQSRDSAWRAPLTGARLYTGCTQRIPQRSRLRRGFVPRSPVTCRRGSNDFSRLDRRGELLLRVVRVDRVRGVRPRVRGVGPDRAPASPRWAPDVALRPPGSLLAPATCYPALRRLPGRDLHPLEKRSVPPSGLATRRCRHGAPSVGSCDPSESSRRAITRAYRRCSAYFGHARRKSPSAFSSVGEHGRSSGRGLAVSHV